jgi:hypothetical protein
MTKGAALLATSGIGLCACGADPAGTQVALPDGEGGSGSTTCPDDSSTALQPDRKTNRGQRFVV